MTGYQYVEQQINFGRWDFDADTFNVKDALAAAFEDGKHDESLTNGF